MSPGVRVKENESFERALRRFRRHCEKRTILDDLRERSHFEKPSERKKRKGAAARRTIRMLKNRQQSRESA